MTNKYSKLVKFEVEDFMGYDHAELDFSDANIYNIKGYNSSGKSALLRGMAVLFFDRWSNKAVKLVKHGKNKFTLRAYFSDGVVIEKEKFGKDSTSKGKSAYTMYNGEGNILYTTKTGVTYSPFQGVPEPIAEYLGMADTLEGINLHYRESRDPILLIDTTGSQNYKYLSTVLKDEELGLAVSLMKDDLNIINNNADRLKNSVIAYNDVINTDILCTEEVVGAINNAYDLAVSKQQGLDILVRLYDNSVRFSSICYYPNIPEVNSTKYTSIFNVVKQCKELQNIKVYKALNPLNTERLQRVELIKGKISKLNSLRVLKPLSSIETSRIKRLESIMIGLKSIYNISMEIKSLKNSIEVETKTLDELVSTDNKVFKHTCSVCGNVEVLKLGGEIHD